MKLIDWMIGILALLILLQLAAARLPGTPLLPSGCGAAGVKAVKKEEVPASLPSRVPFPAGYAWKVFPPGRASRPVRFSTEDEGYTSLAGVLTFRGNHHRTAPAWGRADIRLERLQKVWSFSTASSLSWGGGTGWTGQPVLVRWPTETRRAMNLAAPYRNDPTFVEAVCGSLAGKVYFLDLRTGRPTRDPIHVGNPIKGSVSVHPAGYPLLFVGDGIDETEEFGFRIYSLIDGRRLFFLPGRDPKAPTTWGAFDSSAIVSADDDTLIEGAENGLFYSMRLNSVFDPAARRVSVAPRLTRFRYHLPGKDRHGIENSAAASGNLAWFATNNGTIHCLDLQTMRPRWVLPPGDDTDASITVEVEDGVPYIYTGCEVDVQGTRGSAVVRKLNGLTGRQQWKKSYPCYSVKGEHPVNGGMLATNAVGKHDLQGLVFFTIARYQSHSRGLMVALKKSDGSEAWRWKMPRFAWSSPTDIYTPKGKGYLVQGDSAGRLHLLDGRSGRILHSIELGANIEGSPAVFDDMLVVGTRGGRIYGIRIK